MKAMKLAIFVVVYVVILFVLGWANHVWRRGDP